MIHLSTLHIPLSVTFTLYDNDRYLLDPTLLEEKCSNGILIVTANKFNEICYLHTYGSVKVDTNQVTELMIVTKEKIKYLSKVLKEFRERIANLGGSRDIAAVGDMNIDDEDVSTNKLKIEGSSSTKVRTNIYQLKN
jgi:hypothetical protein